MVMPIVAYIAKGILGIFFDKKYLSGKYFHEYKSGYVWAAKAIFHRNVLRLAPPLPFPAAYGCNISNPKNIDFHVDDLHNFQGNGIYYQNFAAKITLGRNVFIAQNTALITANHDLTDPSKHAAGEEIIIEDNCWIGFGVVILPGVRLGQGTTVAAGAVVTRSFPEGNCILGGIPAVEIRKKTEDQKKPGKIL
ncbi:acyltransferase [Rhodobacter sp. SGA-6-6]|uniref:acyltransferase n=1 Tax=Rhodobacter sp. SGA-6-6 TaxID=2710882 RepID=UPI0013EC49BA|nr:DapH/DapD/GlmU-related protein [Rhodobacter sp. SGA-6-6]NGM44572.1 acyltransferase [Rhodobacter sp. SGA-6-6]